MSRNKQTVASYSDSEAGSTGEAVPRKKALKSINQTSDSSWAILGKLLGLSEPQNPDLQNEVDDDTNIFYLQFVERIQTPRKRANGS